LTAEAQDSGKLLLFWPLGERRSPRRTAIGPCSGDVLIADRRWGHRHYSRSRVGTPALQQLPGRQNTELFGGGMTLMVLDWRAICGTRHVGFSAI